MNPAFRVSIAARASQSASPILLVGSLCLFASSAVGADDFGDLGTVPGTPSKPGQKVKQPARVSPPKNNRTKTKVVPKIKPRLTSPTPVSNGSTGGVQLTGTWRTTDGWIVRLRQNGNRVKGTYTGTGLSGTMNGTFNGKSYSGAFTYRQGAVNFSGKMNLSYSPIDDRLSGNWSTGLYGESINAARISQ